MEDNLIGIGVLLDEHAFNLARKLEIDISKKFATKRGLSQSPHITIKRPFHASNEVLWSIADYLDSLVQEQSFPITISGFGFFEPSVVYIDVEKSKELLGLHEKINHDLVDQFAIPVGPREGENIVFHSTLALNDLSEEDFYGVKKYVSEMQVHYTFDLREIGLFYKVDDYWIIAKKVTVSN